MDGDVIQAGNVGADTRSAMPIAGLAAPNQAFAIAVCVAMTVPSPEFRAFTKRMRGWPRTASLL